MNSRLVWDDETLVLGVIPIGLFFHGLYSFLAAALWAFAMRTAWPTELEEFAAGTDLPKKSTTPA